MRRPLRFLLPLAAPFAAAVIALPALGFTPTREPVSPDGVRATVDLPATEHIRNVGGSDGAGLCVFTSVEVGSRWQAARELDGFQAWMQRRPGGGWPGKLDDMLAAYCREKGVEPPLYVQHTAGDEAFLDTAMRTGRAVAITYAGRDDFYRGRRVAHMVVLAHLDRSVAAIIDNNRPGVTVWMTRAELLQRWRDMGGGWAVVLLNSPPPPYAGKPQQAFGAAPGCVCGDDCKCDAGNCPAKCPVKVGQCCGPDGCRVPLAAAPAIPLATVPAAGTPTRYAVRDLPESRIAPTRPRPGPDWHWKAVPGLGDCWIQDHGGPFDWGFVNGKWDWVPRAAVGEAAENYGVDCSKIRKYPRNAINGIAVSDAEAQSALGASGLADDTDRWHLTCVGDDSLVARFRQDVAALPPDVRGKLHVQTYSPAGWEARQFGLPVGVTLRKPCVGRVSADVGPPIPAGEYTPARLNALLSLPAGPTPAPPPEPDSAKPDRPGPAPAQPANHSTLLIALAGLALVVYLLTRRT